MRMESSPRVVVWVYLEIMPKKLAFLLMFGDSISCTFVQNRKIRLSHGPISC